MFICCVAFASLDVACTLIRTDAGLIECFEVKVGLHLGSVLNPLLFAAVMDVVSSETRSDLPYELLYADDLVLMAPTMEQLGRRVAEWRASLVDKGLEVNAGKSKVMFSAQYVMGGLHGDLSRVADNFRCMRCDCDGTIQEADLAEDLMVDGETYE